MDDMQSVIAIAWAATTIRMATPLVFIGLGGLLSQKAGIFNFGLEGMALAGAFFAFYGAFLSGTPWVGLLFAVVAGAVLGLLLGFTSIRLGVSQFMVGIGIGILASGLTSYLYRLMHFDRQLVAPIFQDLPLPGLSALPVVGPILFSHSYFVYAAFLLVVLIAWFLDQTTLGLKFRAVGENPQVADTAGVDVARYRYFAVIASGILASLGGAFLTLTQVTRFVEEMSAGRGWIALAAVILGKYNPWGVLAACLLFGAADAVQMQAQIMGVKVPHQFLLMTPYIMAILAIAGVVGRVRYPAAQGQPYLKS